MPRVMSDELPCGNAMSDERGKPRVISCAARNVAAYAAITGSEKQARQGEHHTPLLPVNPWRYEQYTEREENLTEFTLA